MVKKRSLLKSDRRLSVWTPGSYIPKRPKAQVLDLFCGCGGMSLGFAAEGRASGSFKMLGGVDIDPRSLASYRKNFGVPAIETDIRDLVHQGDFNVFLEKLDGYRPDLPLVLVGCAPCQGFTAHRKKNWHRSDKRNNLVEVFGDIVVALNPLCVVMENVPELLSNKYWMHFLAFRDRLEKSGYTVKQTIVNSAGYGTPQERFRALVFAMKTQDFGFPRPYLDREHYRSVRHAIGDLPRVKPGVRASGDPLHRSASHHAETIKTIKRVPINGGSRPVGVGPKCLDKIKGFSDVYGRLNWDKPSITITHYARNPASGRYIHPDQHRGLTMREAARLQGFPDSFQFEGGIDDIFRQIGEAVPPHLSVAIATSVLHNMSGRIHDNGVELIESPVSNSYASVIAGIKSKGK